MSEHPIHWETSGTSRIPFAVYTQEDIHTKELERFFYKAHWSYVGLEAEIPNVGDFKRTSIGERSVIMTRSQDGHVHVVENVCAHRVPSWLPPSTASCHQLQAPSILSPRRH